MNDTKRPKNMQLRKRPIKATYSKNESNVFGDTFQINI